MGGIWGSFESLKDYASKSKIIWDGLGESIYVRPVEKCLAFVVLLI